MRGTSKDGISVLVEQTRYRRLNEISRVRRRRLYAIARRAARRTFQMKQLATLSGEHVANIGSQDMNDAIWLKLAHRRAAAVVPPQSAVTVSRLWNTDY